LGAFNQIPPKKDYLPSFFLKKRKDIYLPNKNKNKNKNEAASSLSITLVSVLYCVVLHRILNDGVVPEIYHWDLQVILPLFATSSA